MKIVVVSNDSALVAPEFFNHPAVRNSSGYAASWLVDTQRDKRSTRLKHFLGLVRRQRKITGRGFVSTALGIIVYRLLAYRIKARPTPEDTPNIETISVDSINSSEFVRAVNSIDPDVVCLMGCRILAKKFLDQLHAQVINVHASDPEKIRGGPPVFWEVFFGFDRTEITIHEVLPEVDAGKILCQRSMLIEYSPTLRQTLRLNTANMARTAADLYVECLGRLESKKLKPRTVTKGPLYTTPSSAQIVSACRQCRKKTA